MIANYHTHTPRCRHSEGTEEEYVLSALDVGLQILGFSDHTPQWFPGDYYSHMRMYPHELKGYCDAVRDVQKRYGDRIQIHLGLEVEYYPDLFARVLSEARDNGVEYFILGQHWVGNEKDEPYCGSPTADEAILERYCNQVIEAIQTGYFTYVAHPDLIKFVGDDAIYRKHMRRLCQAANECAVPLEINLLGLETGRNYPDMRMLELMGEENCSVIIGNDAHSPDALNRKAVEMKALEMVEKYGLHLIHTVNLRPID